MHESKEMTDVHARGLTLLGSAADPEQATALQRILMSQYDGPRYPKAVRRIVAALRSSAGTSMADVSDEANARDFVRRTLENASASSTAKRPRQIRVVIAADGVQMPDDAHRLAIFVPNAVAAPVCAALIERTEALGYRTAKMSVAGGDAVVLRDVRDNDTVVLHDLHVADALWESVQPHVPGGATARLGQPPPILLVELR